ncbi:MAG: HEAT repeat domain-containing protein [Planctomycetota bacterium]
MVVLELCLLPTLLFQEPAPTAPPAPADPAPMASPEVVRELQALESGEENDPAQLAHLAQSDNPAVAARAAWVLGQCKQPEAFALLCELAQQSKNPEVRVQAMDSLLRGGQNTAMLTALAGLDDGDHRVRALAAQLLGKLRRPSSASTLLAMLSRCAAEATAESPTVDLQSAVLALADMGNGELLLPAATALAETKARGVGQALTFYFQSQSPLLPPAEEATVLVAVLDHPESLLRRYALMRLGELRVPSTAQALEARLAKEGKELLPLVEVALAQVRHQVEAEAESGAAASDPTRLWTKAKSRWDEMSHTEKFMLGGIGVGGLLSVLIGLAVARSRRRAHRAAAASALAGPSQSYLDAADAEEGDEIPADEEPLDAPAAADEDWVEETFEQDDAENEVAHR